MHKSFQKEYPWYCQERMDNFRANNNSSSPVAKLIPILIVIAGIIGLYYLYQFLFGVKSGTAYTLLSKKQKADVDTPVVISASRLPPLYEGGEFTVSTWIYLQNWSYRSGKNKGILILKGRNFDTFRMYLGGTKPKLYIRFHTQNAGSVPDGNAPSTSDSGDALTSATRSALFQSTALDNNLLQRPAAGCDLPEVDLQRWVNITVAANGRTVDVYMDGKLMRSCVLPTPFKVDTSYTAEVLPFGGFGGQIATTTMYDTALHPEAVYQSYMAGPEAIQSFGDWIASFFTLDVNVSVGKASQ